MVAVILQPDVNPATRWDSELLISHPIYGARPSLRGRFHQLGAVAFVPLGAHLVSRAAVPSGRDAATVYAFTAVAMFMTSAAYHRLAQSVFARFWMRRLDHAMIFVHMAGVATPIAVLCVGGVAGRVMLATAWLLAAVGVVMKMTGLTSDRDPCPWLFPTLGALPLAALPGVAATAGIGCGLALVLAAVLYATGATCFVRKAPNPRPKVFGYHEIWHVFTLLGAGCEFLVVLRIVSV
jgi:hemolysin III